MRDFCRLTSFRSHTGRDWRINTQYGVAENGTTQDLCCFALELSFNPSDAEATFIQSMKMQSFLKTIETLSCWYSLESSR